MRARILAGAAAFSVACALYPTQASAQLLGTCPGLTPPPCIITDAGRIAGTAAEIQEKKKQIEAAVQQVKEYASLDGALGSLGALPTDLRSAITPPSTQAFRPLSSGPQITISEASNALDAVLMSGDNTIEGKNQAEREHRLRLRAAAGEGYAMATATKYKLCRMNKEARRLTRLMQNVNSSGESDMRGDWAINQGAKRLVFDAMLTMREVHSTHLQLKAVQSVPTNVAGSRTGQRAEAPPVAPVQTPGYSLDIGSLANVANKLAALLAARDIIKSFNAGIQGSRDTQTEYQQMKAAAAAAQRRVEAIAASDARRKGISSAALLSIANQYMQRYDRTTWDSPNKAKAAKDAAKRAEHALDNRVKGDANDNWSTYLERRAEAYKQEAFFRPIAADAAAMEKQTLQALAEYETSLGVDASDAAKLNSEIAAAQAELGRIHEKLAQAPADIVTKRDQILSSTGVSVRP